MNFIYPFFLLAFLTSCATNPKHSNHSAGRPSGNSRAAEIKDGAPKGPIPIFFKEPTPKNEPYSRYGNPGSYVVDGKVYKVMKSSGGYKVRGIASWYGTKFHQQRTSSGDKYDMYAMTAAHKTLPLPSYVRVKNLQNGRVAIVKINDRGPFHSDRVIDLSYAAATKLGVFPSGTALVEIEALTTGKQVAHYYLQAGAYSLANSAASLKTKLAKLTPSPVTVEKLSKHYVVKVGPFATRKMSENLKAKLTSNGVKGSFTLLQ
ncbi:MAG: septal ring lytic transglycosylase RlpA family protein [Tatlockia sp.]|nr:septal ring lytic transglycosylase RlpA family protein [Tatlockia sp.]